MPKVEHNYTGIQKLIREDADKTRDLLRQLRLIVEGGQLIEPPLAKITELAMYASRLSYAINHFTIRHDITDSNKRVLYSEYESVMAFVNTEARNEPSLMTTPVIHPGIGDEYKLYREFGFSEQEFRDLLRWKNTWDINNVDMKAAWDFFVSEIIHDLMNGQYTIKFEEIILGVAGVVGVAFDVIFFSASPEPSVPMLVSSCTTGIAAIASKFSEVRRKLLGRGA